MSDLRTATLCDRFFFKPREFFVARAEQSMQFIDLLFQFFDALLFGMGFVKERVQFLLRGLFPEPHLYRMTPVFRCDTCKRVCFSECEEGNFRLLLGGDFLFHVRVLYTVHRGELVWKDCLIFSYHHTRAFCFRKFQ